MSLAIYQNSYTDNDKTQASLDQFDDIGRGKSRMIALHLHPSLFKLDSSITTFHRIKHISQLFFKIVVHHPLIYLQCHKFCIDIINEHKSQAMGRDNCQRCDSIPEDILVLQCEHKICLGCASAILDYIQHKINCNVCHKQTYLDRQIVRQLMALSEQSTKTQTRISRKKQPQIPFKKTKKSSHKNMISEHQTIAFRYNSKQISKKNWQSTCRSHPEYEIMYICKQCNNSFICPECIIHGSHRNHDVVSFKCFLGETQLVLEEEIRILEDSVEEIFSLAQERREELAHRMKDIQKLKDLTIDKYNIIRHQLSKQENQLLEELDILLDYYDKDLNDLDFTIEKDTDLLTKKKQQISQLLEPLHLSTNSIAKSIEIQIINQCLQYQIKHAFNTNQILYKPQKYAIKDDKSEDIEILTDRISNIQLQRAENQNIQCTKKLKKSLIKKLYSEGRESRCKDKENVSMASSKIRPEYRMKNQQTDYYDNKQDFLVF